MLNDGYCHPVTMPGKQTCDYPSLPNVIPLDAIITKCVFPAEVGEKLCGAGFAGTLHQAGGCDGFFPDSPGIPVTDLLNIQQFHEPMYLYRRRAAPLRGFSSESVAGFASNVVSRSHPYLCR